MEKFTLKTEHLQLLSHVYTSWYDCEFGAPSIDPKRPYGNSDVIPDIRRILEDEGPRCPQCGYELEYQCKYTDGQLLKLHKETQVALEIVLRTQSFVLGVYVADDYSANWRLQNG